MSGESCWSLVGGRRGSLGSRSASPGQTSHQAPRGPAADWAGGRTGNGRRGGGACGWRRRGPRRAPPADPGHGSCSCRRSSQGRLGAALQHTSSGCRASFHLCRHRARPAWLKLCLRPHHPRLNLTLLSITSQSSLTLLPHQPRLNLTSL